MLTERKLTQWPLRYREAETPLNIVTFGTISDRAILNKKMAAHASLYTNRHQDVTLMAIVLENHAFFPSKPKHVFFRESPMEPPNESPNGLYGPQPWQPMGLPPWMNPAGFPSINRQSRGGKFQHQF